MPLPIPIAASAVAAGAAYLNARAGILYDGHLLASILPTVLDLAWSTYRGRLSLFYRLESLATSKGSRDRPFLLFEDRRYTFAETYDHVLRCGNWLRSTLGVEKGQVVALDFQNTDSFVFLILALWAIGAKPAFINYNLTGEPLIHCVRKAGVSLVLVDPNVAEQVTDDVRAGLPGVRLDIFSEDLEVAAMSMDPVRFPDEVRGEDSLESMAILIYTSGTTGLPKAAIVSWAKLLVLAGFISNLIGMKTTDVYYVSMPLYHSTATLMGLGPTILRGATLALGRKFSTSRFWDEVRQHDATIIQYVGETCRYLLSAPVQRDPATGESLDRRHKVRVAYGNGLRPDVWTRFRDRFGIDTVGEFYGSTEGSFATFNISRNDFSAGAVGRSGWLYRLLVGSGLAVVQFDHEAERAVRDAKTGFCVRVRAGEPGELLFKLPPNNVERRFQGYYGDKEATGRKVMRDVFRRGDAWFSTGDVVRLDGEGRMYFADRVGDTFRWKSENVPTAEVAHVLGLHPAVREANVYGVSLPHHEGRAGCAAVVLDPAADVPGAGGVSADALRGIAEHVRKGLPRYALPIFLRVLRGTAMQTTGTNKQQKHQLREEGVAPDKTTADEVYWLRDGTYVRFGTDDWAELNGGQVKL